MTRTVSQIRSFREKKLFCLFSTVERERTLMLGQGDPALHLRQFQIQDVPQLIAIETPKNYSLVDPIHEFRRAFALRCIHGDPMNLAVYFFGPLVVGLRRETNAAGC